ncbi:hypothetical protein WR25_12273 isoform B [Diploscapter pachys]|uniref:Uncharacterized protein n=1 Tax=Diploscapter pachys TaxID=2018661 RepID=A0A2A2JVB8_9BILA|nr:hypothetical protein WR25_12273 isoform B [Diploscapter pachys]
MSVLANVQGRLPQAKNDHQYLTASVSPPDRVSVTSLRGNIPPISQKNYENYGTVMDFFDVRKFAASAYGRDVVLNDGRFHILRDYSAVAFLPIIMIVVIVIGICSVYQYRKWKHERRQMEHLSNLYEILESSPCPHARKSFSPMKDSDLSPPMATNCERISRAVSLPLQETSPFFQPSARNKTLRAGGLRHINNAEEVFFHFTNLANNSPLLGPRQHQAATAVVVPQQPQPKYERQNGTFYQKINGDVNGDYHEAYIIQEI